MRARSPLIIAALILCLTAVSCATAVEGDGDDETTDTVTVYGYVLNVSDSKGNTPLSNVTVSVFNPVGNSLGQESVLGSVRTGTDGYFELSYVNSLGAYIKFEREGYSIRVLPGDWMTMQDGGMVQLSLDKASAYIDENGKYNLSDGDGSVNRIIGMGATNGTLYGYVNGINDGETFAVEGADVSAVSSNGRTFTTTTGANGYFEIIVPYGTYTLKASCNGFTSSSPWQATTDNDFSIELQMTQNKSGIDMLGGLDAPHAVMVVSIITIGVILMLSTFAIHRSRLPQSDIKVINDMEEIDKLERPRRDSS